MTAVRLARPADAAAIAALHATRITEGFLPTLGAAFLTRLYRRIARSSRAFAVVATDDADVVVGFAAATTDLGALYREFVLRDGIVAGALAAPRLVRSWRKVVETLRYPATIGELPDAEILAVAVDPALAGTGIGSRLVGAATHELGRRGVTAAKVVTGADNVAALRLYERCGFTARERVAVHHGVASEVLVWPSS